MLVKAADIMHANVVVMENQQIISNIQDVIYNPEKQRIVALIINGTNFISAQIIPFDKIKQLTKNTIFINSQEDIKKIKDIIKEIQQPPLKEEYLVTTKVFTEKGFFLGVILDVYFDSKTGDVKEFLIVKRNSTNENIKQTRISIKNLLAMQDDTVIVKDIKRKTQYQQT